MNNSPTQLPTIIKSSGEREEFSLVKFRHSLDKSGLTPEEQDKLIEIIKQKHFKNTKELFAFTRSYLHKKNPVLSSRYSLKKALFELGPAGFPFEQFVAALFQEKGYEIETDVILSGWCIDHEIDVVAKKEHQIEIIECKFHGNTLLKTNVKVTLYIKARFDDIFKKLTQDQTVTLPQDYAPWLISNTRFTSNAIAYARCAHLELLGWSFPPNNGLQQWIEAAHLH
ncbi:MAG: restriction endonuclease, partial [Candidatus Babeliales bacterium]